MRLSVRHIMRLAADPPGGRCVLRLRLYPSAFDAQRVAGWRLAVNGQVVPALLTTGFGDRESIWTCDGRSEGIEVAAEGEVETQDVAGTVKGLRDAARPAVYLRETALTQPDDCIRALAAQAAGANPLARLHALCAAVRDGMELKPGAEGRSAAQALKSGEGSAVDMAQLFVAAARALGAPARHVVGYLLAEPDRQADLHAWAEAYVPDIGWIGFDPSSRLCPTDRYVRLASGLDSADASPVRGNGGGRALETAPGSIDISEVAAQMKSMAQSQTQQ